MLARLRALPRSIPVVWIVVLHAALLWLSFGGEPRGLAGDEYTYMVAAQRLATTGELVLDPLWPPLYPWFLAAVVTLGGSPLAMLAVVQTALLVAAALSLRAIVASVLGSQRAGNHAAFLMLGYPTLAAFAHYAWPEVLFLGLFLGACALLVRRPESIAAAAVAGMLAGGALLAKLVLWPFLPVLVLPLLVRGSSRSRTAAVVVVALAVTVVLAGGRMLRPQGGAARLDTTIAFNVLLGLKDASRRSLVDPIAGEEYRAYLDSAPDTDARTRILREKVRALVAERGVLAIAREQLAKQYVRLFDPESFFTAQLPGGALEGTASGYRDVPHRLATMLRVIAWLAYFALLGLAAAGAAMRPWRAAGRIERAWLGVFAAFLAYNLAIFSVLYVVSRYRIAFLPVLFLFAAAATDRLTTTLSAARSR